MSDTFNCPSCNASLSVVSAAPPPRTLLTQADFSYAGAFRFPATAGNWSDNGVGYTEAPLTHRYNGSHLRFFSTTHAYSGNKVFEMAFPGLGSGGVTANWPQATVVKAWGDIYQGHRYDGNGQPNLNDKVLTYGLRWHEPEKRLYWSSGDYYDPGQAAAGIGYSTLDDIAGVAKGVGSWRVQGATNNYVKYGSLCIPKAFADAHLGGRSLAVGFGGQGGASSSYGPCMFVIGDPTGMPDKAVLPSTRGWLHPYTYVQGGPPVRARRTADYKEAVFGAFVKSATASTVTLGGAGNPVYGDGRYANHTLTIVAGAGAGQTVTLSAGSGFTYNISPAWSVIPDTTSEYELPVPEYEGAWTPLPNGTGFWTGNDGRADCAWIDTPTRHGILVVQTFATGRQYYGPGGTYVESIRHEFMIYDPQHLAEVFAGTKKADAVDPVSRWTVVLPGAQIKGNPRAYSGGVTWDAVSKRVFLAVKNGWWSGEWKPCVHAFGVNA